MLHGLSMDLSVAKSSKSIAGEIYPFGDTAPPCSLNQSNRGHTPSSELFSLLERSISRGPLAIAVRDASSGESLTFAQLARQSATVAAQICSSFGAIALYFEPSPAYIVAVLAAIQLGIPYLAIDPRTPRLRQEQMLVETNASVLLCSSSTHPDNEFTNVKIFHIEDLLDRPTDEPKLRQPAPDQPTMCILYTSGSTNGPKGVQIPYSAVLNRLSWQWRTQPFGDDDVVAFKTRIGFVDSIAELLAPLLQGIPVVAIQGSLLYDVKDMVKVLKSFEVTRITVVPSFLRRLLSSLEETPGVDLPLKVVVSSGEELLFDVCESFFLSLPRCQLHNYYGSTEVMGDVTAIRLHSIEDARAASLEGRISIGTPIDGMRLALRECNDHGIGEVFCAGPSLMAGYLGGSMKQSSNSGPLSTAKEFHLEHLSSDENEKWFRTGDMALIKGENFFFCGRHDDMVKIAGNKVDVGHVERVIREVGIFTMPPALVYSRKLVKLILFFRPEKSIDMQCLSKGLSSRLASHEIPAFAPVDEFLFLPTSGKIDKKAMLARYEDSISKSQEISYDWGDLEYLDPLIFQQLQDFVAVLGNEGIRSESIQTLLASNFFTAGGTSLNSMACVFQFRKRGMGISMADLLAGRSLWQVFDSSIKKEAFSPPSTSTPRWSFKPLDHSNASQAYELIASNMLDTRPVSYIWKSSSDPAETRKNCYDELIEITRNLEPFTLRSPPISFGLFDPQNSMIGACCSMLSDKAPDDPPSDGIIGQFVQYLAELEEHAVNQVKQITGSDRFMENFIVAVDREKLFDAGERVECMYAIEEELLRVAHENKASFLITTNTSPVTQDIARLFGYVEERVSNACVEWTDTQGNPYVPFADDEFKVQVAYKLLEA